MEEKPKPIFKEISLPIYFIEENGQVTAHTPVLDLATCGKDFDEAKNRFAEIVVIFLRNCLKWELQKKFSRNADGRRLIKNHLNGNLPELLGN